MLKFNPYRPGSIVTHGMFAGRLDELQTLEKILFQTKHENPQHFLLSGERGIGKSSLLYYLELVASGKITSLDNATFRFLTLSIELEPSDSFASITKKLGKCLRDSVAKRESIKDLAKAGWDFLKRWEILGVKYTSPDNVAEDHELLETLCISLNQTVEKLADHIDGCLILIDEADKPNTPSLGSLSKLLTERLTKLGCNRVTLGLAGVTGIVNKLRESHESSPRIFHSMTLGPLSAGDRINVIKKGLAEAEKKNGSKTDIREDALNSISVLSEGFPNFIQQFAFCAFDADTDNVITIEDVTSGANKKDGAFQQLGQKYFTELYFEQIGSDEYRQVLRAMAQHEDDWVTKAQIREAVKMKAGILDNAISALKKRNIITAQLGQQGIYKLPTKSFAVWLRAFTVDPTAGTTTGGEEVIEVKGEAKNVGKSLGKSSEAPDSQP